MTPVHFPGLNCYHDCVISIANALGIHYSAAFSTLWSETDFRFDPHRSVYLTKRMITNLELLGVKEEHLNCRSQDDVERQLSRLHNGAFVIVGMDAFHIPWNPFYQTFHGPHYFIAQNAAAETLRCVDPTYAKESETIARRDVIAHTVDMIDMRSVARTALQPDVLEEARAILHTHDDTRKCLLARIRDSVDGGREPVSLLAKYIDTMICNRRLYCRFLAEQPCNESDLWFSRDFFTAWAAVKNGMYKVRAVKDNARVVDDVCDYVERVFDAELNIAQTMLQRF